MKKRLHLFEFEDLEWFPKKLRHYATDFLEFGANKFDIYKPIIPIIEKGLQSSGANKILDIASGSGGGLLKLSGHLQEIFPILSIVLSDYYPNTSAFRRTKKKNPQVFDYYEIQIDARNIQDYILGFRTMFLSFHHFKPADAKAILQNAVNANQPIGIFEAQQRNIKSLIPMLLSPISVLLMTPFIRPFSLVRLIFTYLIPILPLVVVWDGVVSVLRTYTVDELNEMISELNHHDKFKWEVNIAKGKTNDIIYLLGLPNEDI